MKSLRAAINAKCKECIYDPIGDGNWRQQVMACMSPECPLYSVRPVSTPETPKQRAKRLAMAIKATGAS